MLISELTVYDFLKDKIKLSDSDAKRYAKEMASAEEKLRYELRVDISSEIKNGDYATKTDMKELEIRIEKGFRETIMWIIGFMVAIATLSVTIIKMF